MSNYGVFLETANVLIQLVLLIFAGVALFTWRRELRGSDQYAFAKEMLAYIQKIRFFVYTNNGTAQIVINDFLVDGKIVWDGHLAILKDQKIYFDSSVFNLFSHINTRSDILMPKEVRTRVDALVPNSGETVTLKDGHHTYIHLAGLGDSEKSIFSERGWEEKRVDIFKIQGMEHWTMEEYFKEWETLARALKKYI